jgi:hypothetical protein
VLREVHGSGASVKGAVMKVSKADLGAATEVGNSRRAHWIECFRNPSAGTVAAPSAASTPKSCA